MALTSAIPILAFLDLKETLAFYTKLGFECNGSWEHYIICSKDDIEIHLWLTTDESVPKNTGCYIRVNEIDALFQQYASLNIIHPHGSLEDKPWGMRQFSILDNSGNIIHFGQPFEYTK